VLTEDQKKSIIRNLPEDFTFEDTMFHVQKLYANQFECENLPAVVLQYTTTDNIVNSVLRNVLKETKHRTETLRPTPSDSVTINLPSVIKTKATPTAPGGYSTTVAGIAYLTAWNGVLSGCGSLGGRTCDFIAMGQTMKNPGMGVNWWIWRTFVYFNVMGLPLSALLSVARLKFKTQGKYDGEDRFFTPIPFTDFDIDVQQGDGVHPTLPKLMVSDPSRLFYSGSGSVKMNTAAMVIGAWSSLELTNAKAWIVAARAALEEYRMVIRAQDDIDGNEVIGGELAWWDPADGVNAPYIEATYTVPKVTFECDHVKSVQEVTGTVGGLPYTFDPAEYELIEEGPAGFFKALKFLGPNIPDANTDVTIDYTSACLWRTLAAMKSDNLLVNVYCDDVFDGERKINGIKLCNYIAMKVHQWFEYTFQDNTMTVGIVGPIQDGDYEVEGEIIRRKYFTIPIIYWEVLEETPLETIEEVDKVPVTTEL
jgi:hypothetical protein